MVNFQENYNGRLGEVFDENLRGVSEKIESLPIPLG